MSQQGFMGALAGAGKAAADVGGFMMRDTMQRRQQEETSEREARVAELRERRGNAEWDRRYGVERKDKVSDDELAHNRQLEVINAQSRARAKEKGDKQAGGTNSAKEYQEMLALGVPDKAARGIAYGTYKTVADQSTGDTVVVDMADNGREVGRMTPTTPGDIMAPRTWVPADKQAPPPMTSSELETARDQLNKETGKGGDFIPFNEYGADAPEVAERAQKNRGGFLSKEGGAPKGKGGSESLPEGIPAGSRQVGTSKGRPVYEAPNGKRYIVE